MLEALGRTRLGVVSTPGVPLPVPGAVPCLPIEREPERGIEVELRALVPGLLPGLLAKGRAGVVEVSSEREPCRSGRIRRVRRTRARPPRGAPRGRRRRWRRPPGRSPRSHRRRAAALPSLRAIAAASSKQRERGSRSPSSSSTQPRVTSAKPIPRVSSMSRASSSDSSSLLRAAAVFLVPQGEFGEVREPEGRERERRRLPGRGDMPPPSARLPSRSRRAGPSGRRGFPSRVRAASGHPRRGRVRSPPRRGGSVRPCRTRREREQAERVGLDASRAGGARVRRGLPRAGLSTPDSRPAPRRAVPLRRGPTPWPPSAPRAPARARRPAVRGPPGSGRA